MKIDLHLHTNYSDGRLSPEEILKLCKERGYNIVSIADHDNIDGYLSVRGLAKDYGITLVPGLELSSNYQGIEIHILAYFFDEKHPALTSLLESINKNRLERAKKIVEKLSKIGINLNLKTIIATTGKSGIVGRMHIARALIDKGYCYSNREAFDRYLHDQSESFEPKETLPAEKAIPMIASAGGISILAHPHKLDNIATVYGVVEMGINGLEIYCPKASSYASVIFKQLTEHYGLLETGGSDFHGEGEELNDFGKYSAPYEVWERLLEFREEMKSEKARCL